MGRYASESGDGDFHEVPPGTYTAICIGLIDIGTRDKEWQGQVKKRNELVVQWELPEERMDVDGVEKPMVITKFYTNSLSENANLRADLRSWRGRDFTPEELAKFDLQNILGKGCLLSIVHKPKKNSPGKMRASVEAVMGLAKGTKLDAPVNKLRAFWLDEEPFNATTFGELSDGIKKLIVESDEYKAMQAGPRVKHGSRPAFPTSRRKPIASATRSSTIGKAR